MELNHTRLGISSFILSLGCLIGLLGILLFTGLNPDLVAGDNVSRNLLLIGFSVIACGVLSGVALILSVAGFLQRKCKKIFTYLGFLLSVIVIFSVYKVQQAGHAELEKEFNTQSRKSIGTQSRSSVSSNVESYEERARKAKLDSIEREKQEKVDKEQLKQDKLKEKKERLFNAKVENINTPGTIKELASSDNGKYLIFLLKGSETSIQVFDTERESFTAKLVLQTSRVHIAANSEYVFVANVNDNSLTKLAIKDLKELSKITLISKGSISNITAASDSATAPIGVIAGEQFKFYNAKTLREIKTSWFSENYNRELSNGLDRRIYEGAKLRSSPNGKFFTFWNLNVSPTGVNLISIENVGSELNAVLNNEHTTAGYLSPINNGSVYTNFNGIYNQDLKVISSEDFKNNHLIPVQGSDAFISIMISRENTRGLVINGGSEEVLTNLGELYMMHNTDHKYSFHKQEINPDQRYFWYPKQNKLIVIPYINNEIVSIKYK